MRRRGLFLPVLLLVGALAFLIGSAVQVALTRSKTSPTQAPTLTQHTSPAAETPSDGLRESLALRGRMHIRLYDSQGNLVDERSVNNLITHRGKASILSEAFDAFNPIDHNPGGVDAHLPGVVHIGDCGADNVCNPPTPSDTALERYLHTMAFHSSALDIPNKTVSLEYRIGGGGGTIREVGIVSSSGGVLVNRVLLTPPVVYTNAEWLVVSMEFRFP